MRKALPKPQNSFKPTPLSKWLANMEIIRKKLNLTHKQYAQTRQYGIKPETYIGLKKLRISHEKIIEIHKSIFENKGMLPVCSYYEKIRIGPETTGKWINVPIGTKDFLLKCKEFSVSHSVSPEAYEEIVKPQLEQLEREMEQRKK